MIGISSHGDEESRRSGALARLLRLLLCGEQSAALAFDLLGHRRNRLGDAAELVHQLRSIAAEEREHERLLAAWLSTLPSAPAGADELPAAQRFYRELAHLDGGVHFTRIAALDSAVCLLLAALRKAQPMLCHPALARIARDEARHVVAANHYARRLCAPGQRRAIAGETRAGLVALLSRQADAMDILDIDVDRLLRSVARVPRFLRQ